MEEYRLRLFQNRELRIISGPKREKVTKQWRKLHITRIFISYTPHQI
jgi:hypothetical protein